MALVRAATEVEAANVALGHLSERITALNEDKEAARAVTDQFASARTAMLRMHPWNFAKTYETIAADPTALPGTFSKIFPLPSNCLLVRSVAGLEEDSWSVESAKVTTTQEFQNVLSCDLDAARICYTRDVTQVALWDSLFLKLFGLQLASECAGRLGFGQDKAQALANEARAGLPLSRRVDRREASRSTVTGETSFVTVRR
jgi:hypothetical protein